MATMDRDRIQELMAAAAAEADASQPPGEPFRPEDTALLCADGGQLSSLAVITFILGVEERLSEALSRPVLLFDEKLVADPDGPFRTIGSFTDHIQAILSGDGVG